MISEAFQTLLMMVGSWGIVSHVKQYWDKWTKK